MKFAMLARITVILLVAVLSLGPVVSFAAPTMSAEQGATSKMAMSDGQAANAETGCTGCSDSGMAKANMGAACNVVCLSPVALPAGIAIAEREATPQWTTVSVAAPPGITTAVDPDPPNLLS